jgi:hypothetical protein
MSKPVKRGQTDVKTAYEEKLDRIVNKALKYIQDPTNEDKLVKLEEVKNEAGEWVVAIGKCKGNTRAFPCVYIEDKQSGRGFTLSVVQMHNVLKAINGLTDEAYSRLGVFIEKAMGARPMRRKREVSEEASEEGSAKNNEEGGEQ